MRATFVSAIAAVVCFQAPAFAQTSDAANQERARAFVDLVAVSTSDARARWDDRICVGAVGLATDQAQALVDRISARAQALGLRAGEPGCQANVMVIYAPDSDAISRQIVDQRRDLLGYFAQDGQATLGRDALDDFANTPRPVRWWHVSSTGYGTLRPETALTRQTQSQTTALAAASRDGGEAPSGMADARDMQGTDGVRVSGSRARSDERNDLTYALVVVDARRVADVPASTWMDYVAFVALAQVDPYASTADYPTILNAFAEASESPTALTDWDTAYLEALYRSRGAGNRQAADIARRMNANFR